MPTQFAVDELLRALCLPVAVDAKQIALAIPV